MTKQYYNETQGSADPLRQLSHRSRFRVALSLINGIAPTHVLDFGGGDGTFLTWLGLGEKDKFSAVLFEPYKSVVDGPFVHVKAWADVEAIAAQRPFDLVSCQEVMEHFSAQRQDDALARISSVLAPSGRLVLSVPVEMGPVAIVKNLGRWKYRPNHPGIYTLRNLWRSLVAAPIPHARQGDHYLSHMGFYFTDFRKLLERRFIVEKIVGSPFSMLPALANSQVFFVCKPRPSSFEERSHL